MTKMAAKWLKLIANLWPKRLKNHTLWGRTYLYSPYKRVPPPGIKNNVEWQTPSFRLNFLSCLFFRFCSHRVLNNDIKSSFSHAWTSSWLVKKVFNSWYQWHENQSNERLQPTAFITLSTPFKCCCFRINFHNVLVILADFFNVAFLWLPLSDVKAK